MAAKASIALAALFWTSCTGVRSVQLQPPIPPPAGLVWGYGVEKVGKSPETGRQSAYLKAIDDLLTRGPVVVSKVIEDNTSVVNTKSATRTMESTFRLRASRMLQPGFMETGIDGGFVWVLLGTTQEDIERGWQQFVAWRSQKVEHARALLQTAQGPDRLAVLKASFSLLEEAGAQDDPSLLYYEVKTALDAEVARTAGLESAQKQFRTLMDSGQLAGAELALDQALQNGLDQSVYSRFRLEVLDRRRQAAHLIAAGDDLFRDQQYKDALARYQQAERLDRNNPQLPTKLAMADRYHRAARAQTVRETVGFVGWGATRVLGEYFEYKREEEARKRAEGERAESEARADAERLERERRRSGRHDRSESGRGGNREMTNGKTGDETAPESKPENKPDIQPEGAPETGQDEKREEKKDEKKGISDPAPAAPKSVPGQPDTPLPLTRSKIKVK